MREFGDYKYFESPNVAKAGAEITCTSLGLELAKITTADQFNSVQEFADFGKGRKTEGSFLL